MLHSLLFPDTVFLSSHLMVTEFVLFDKVAAGALGEPLVTVLHHRHPGHASAETLANAARFDMGILPEIGHLIGQKYRLLVSILKKWRSA
jgi:hypothetical protein